MRMRGAFAAFLSSDRVRIQPSWLFGRLRFLCDRTNGLAT